MVKVLLFLILAVLAPWLAAGVAFLWICYELAGFIFLAGLAALACVLPGKPGGPESEEWAEVSEEELIEQ